MHHQQKRPGSGQGHTPTADTRKSVIATDSGSRHRRPGLTRRHTPVSAQKLGRSHREREREQERERDKGRDRGEDRVPDEDRLRLEYGAEWLDTWDDERESFPQFCMTCEKQFVPQYERHLYCSETCRRIDHSSTYQVPPTPAWNQAKSILPPLYSAIPTEPRDIIPRAVPSRPNSTYLSHTPPDSPGTKTSPHHASTLSALRSLNLGPSSSDSSSPTWFYGRSAVTSPGNSYRRPSAPYMEGLGAAAYTYTYDTGPNGWERPLPTRHPGAYSRPKSIELVTPIIGR